MSKSEHPALKDFSPIWETVKIVGSKALKWGAIVGLGFAAFPAVVGSVIGGLGSVIGLGSTALGGAQALNTGSALISGIALGGIAGAVSGAGSISEKLEEARQDHIADWERAQVARERGQLMARTRGQGVPSGGVSPNVGYGRGQQTGHGIG